MIGTEHKTEGVVRHTVRPDTVRPDGKIDRREAADFILQTDRVYEKTTGHQPESDDAYYVGGDEDGPYATWETDDQDLAEVTKAAEKRRQRDFDLLVRSLQFLSRVEGRSLAGQDKLIQDLTKAVDE